MSNGSDNKFNMFEGLDVEKTRKVLHDDSEVQFENTEDEDVEIVSITMKTDTRKKYAASVIARSQEEYETYIIGSYFETLIHPETKEEYQVKITVLKPEVNPMETMKPAYAYSTNH
ncbi:hypothetical protein [Yersinia phage fHe-Yen9-04]|uniref:Uncharacterized protein n=2 Tax=Eneladusvirus Yen904 TaxID=2560849 RepID=A0A2C9CWX4_9CAUD|nr:hypothetical protein FDJ41_gp043 [Yersinia phage fHe-Yen9-04]SOK58320.1 hypothetical protein [Yersinia phage fHe-Yen9-04]SOK58858.1 hypothetical protein [Yersinia phage fHe-Yen9-03]VUE36089.1 hypothetical protein [Yersinia phage fHe-Yen9-04]